MDVTVMSGVTDRNTVQALIETINLSFVCAFFLLFVQESGLIIYGPTFYCSYCMSHIL